MLRLLSSFHLARSVDPVLGLGHESHHGVRRGGRRANSRAHGATPFPMEWPLLPGSDMPTTPLPCTHQTPTALDPIVSELLNSIPRLTALARRLTGQRQDADDLVQATCLRVIERREKLRTSSNVGGWFASILRNLNTDWRRSSRQVPPLHLEDVPAPAAVGIAPWRRVSDEDLDRAVRCLTPAQREAWELSELQHLTLDEIAEEIKLAAATIGTRIHRARKALRRQLSDGDGMEDEL